MWKYIGIPRMMHKKETLDVIELNTPWRGGSENSRRYKGRANI